MSLDKTGNGIASLSCTGEGNQLIDIVKPRGGSGNRRVWPGQEMELRHCPAHGEKIS